VKLRITAKASSENEALGLIRPVEEAIRERLGLDAVPGNPDTLAEALGNLLRERGATIACAESLTGGLIGSALTHAGGSSDFYLGSIVAYATEAKAKLLGIDEAILAGPGPVSDEAASALAEGAVSRFGADLGISATGVAGPAPQDGMPVGTIFVGATFGGATEVRRVKGYGDRENIRAVAASAALDLGRRLVQTS
jgi:nicotinamide-nucleotide amidase